MLFQFDSLQAEPVLRRSLISFKTIEYDSVCHRLTPIPPACAAVNALKHPSDRFSYTPMKTLRLIPAAAFTAVVLVTSGCIAAIGNREPARSNATLGQQLIDLQKARDSGALTETEYQAQREKFLSQK